MPLHTFGIDTNISSQAARDHTKGLFFITCNTHGEWSGASSVTVHILVYRPCNALPKCYIINALSSIIGVSYYIRMFITAM
jgi:hypothetical protein